MIGSVSKQGERTIVCQFLPNTINPLNLGLAAQNALGTDFTSHARHLGGEIAQLVHHGVYCALEGGDFRVHFHVVQPYSLGQVTTGDRRQDVSDFSERFLERLVGLLVLPQLSLECRDTLLLDDGERLFLELFLLQQLRLDAGQLLSLAVEEFALVVNMLSQALEGFVGQWEAGCELFDGSCAAAAAIAAAAISRHGSLSGRFGDIATRA